MNCSKRTWAVLWSVAIALGCGGLTSQSWAFPRGEAFRGGMIPASWSSAVKQFFGTAYEAYDAHGGFSDSSSTAPISHVWFTGAHGVLTEVYWPTLDSPQVKDSQFLVTDGKTFFFEERKDSETEVDWLERGVPAFRVINRDPNGRFSIEKTIFADPDRDAIIQKVRVTRNVPGLKFFLLHKPAVGNTPMGNSAMASLGGRRGPGSENPTVSALLAWQADQAQALIASCGMKKVSAGFEGASDGWQDLHEDLRMDWSFETATHGNVALTGWLDLPETVGTSEFEIVLAFGQSAGSALELAEQALRADGSSHGGLLGKYLSQWKKYQDSVFDLGGVSGDGGRLFRSSVAVLKSMEDKTHPGAYVASPTIPWGEHVVDQNEQRTDFFGGASRTHLTGGYHLVWPRDLVQMATTFMAIKDYASAEASLKFLSQMQYGPKAGSWQFGFRVHARDGSFPQNAWVTGEPFWQGLQLDETAMPVLLAYRLWQAGQIAPGKYWDMVRRAADFISDFGPWTEQERWEEAMGASPSTIAAEISALWAASKYAMQMHDLARAQKYQETADSWSSKPGDNIGTWTFTTTGGIGDGRYFVRVVGATDVGEIWNPDSDRTFFLANGAGQFREKDVIDGGFLELVRDGVRMATDPEVLESVPKLDTALRVDLPGIGPGFRRYNHDRYNYDDVTGTQTDGMLWPLLTGERGHYELERARESRASFRKIEEAVDPYIQTMEKMSTETQMLPEQVWDGGRNAGKSTGSATPLGWAHGEYIKLLRSRQDHAVFDRLQFH